MITLLYALLIGLPAAACCFALGLIFMATIFGIPIGLAFFALGFRIVAPPRW